MSGIEIKEFYAHEHTPSIFIMFRKDYQVVWCYSGNELRRAYLQSPDEFISGPLEVPIPEHLNQTLTEYYEG